MIRRPRHGKIARLPNAVRNLLNQKLRDNVAASKIAAWLQAEHGPAVKEAGLGRSIRRNISAWRQGGYADWERQQERLEEMRAQQEFAFQLACKTDGSLQAANLAIAASQIYEALQDFDVGELTVRLKEKPELYAVLLEGISKLSRAGLGERRLQLELTKYQDKVAEQKRQIQAQLDKAKAGGLTPETMSEIQAALNLL